MDFTQNKLKILYKNMIDFYDDFLTFEEYLKASEIKQNSKFLILRHDVDKNPYNSLKFALIQNKINIKGTYYFRMLPCSWNENIVREISDLGHEIGYHYETMDEANGNVDLAWDHFRRNLDEMRKVVNVSTICMHGSPRSKYDNKDLWMKFDYKSLDIIGEPYLDIDFNKIFYLTDTGRRWDGWKYSVRDIISENESWNNNGYVYKKTDDIIDAIIERTIPKNIMFTFHPQRWHDNSTSWFIELCMQNIKNNIKKLFYVKH